MPDPRESCGPYSPDPSYQTPRTLREENMLDLGDDEIKDGNGDWSHDTIGLIGVDEDSKIVVGTSTNGAGYKVPGSVCYIRP